MNEYDYVERQVHRELQLAFLFQCHYRALTFTHYVHINYYYSSSTLTSTKKNYLNKKIATSWS